MDLKNRNYAQHLFHSDAYTLDTAIVKGFISKEMLQLLAKSTGIITIHPHPIHPLMAYSNLSLQRIPLQILVWV